MNKKGPFNSHVLEEVGIRLQQTLKDLHIIRDCWLMSFEPYYLPEEKYVLISLWHEDQDDWGGRKWTKKAQTYIETLLDTKLEKKKLYDIDPKRKGSYEVLSITEAQMNALYVILKPV